MYGGIGLPSAKGSGTNGYVQRSLAYIPYKYKPGNYGEIMRELKKNPAPMKRKINDEIINHEERYKIEIELFDLKEKLENEGKKSKEEINQIINEKRKTLLKELNKNEKNYMDNTETHQKGKLKDAQMVKMKEIIKNYLK